MPKRKFKFIGNCNFADFEKIQKNRDDFVEEFNITNYCNNISYKNSLRMGLWSDNYLNGIEDCKKFAPTKYDSYIYGDEGKKNINRLLDHLVDLKSKNCIVRVISPYDVNDKDLEIYQKNGFYPYKPLYTGSAHTFIKVINTKKFII